MQSPPPQSTLKAAVLKSTLCRVLPMVPTITAWMITIDPLHTRRPGAGPAPYSGGKRGLGPVRQRLADSHGHAIGPFQILASEGRQAPAPP